MSQWQKTIVKRHFGSITSLWNSQGKSTSGKLVSHRTWNGTGRVPAGCTETSLLCALRVHSRVQIILGHSCMCFASFVLWRCIRCVLRMNWSWKRCLYLYAHKQHANFLLFLLWLAFFFSNRRESQLGLNLFAGSVFIWVCYINVIQLWQFITLDDPQNLMLWCFHSRKKTPQTPVCLPELHEIYLVECPSFSLPAPAS